MRQGLPTAKLFYVILATVIGIALLIVLIWGSMVGQPPCALDPAQVATPRSGPGGDRPDYLHTCGNRLYDAGGHEVQITGINWFGMETNTFAPHGLWVRNYKSMLDQISALGYNTIRLPYSNEALRSGKVPQGIDFQLNPDLRGLTALEVMDRIIAGARERGLKVILDQHRPDSQAQSSVWYTKSLSEEQWIADWKMLAQRYLGDDTVIGFDLHNEPREPATWGTGDVATDWRLAAERAGDAVLAINPYLLIFVEGVDHTGNDYYWWGGDLTAAGKFPVVLNVPNRVVYSPHDYGPEVFQQGWFSDPTFPRNMPAIWDKYWGYIQQARIAPVVLGEFGGRSVGSDLEGVWQRALLSYLQLNRIGFIAWTLNPDSGDTGGVLQDDWLTVVQAKQDIYRQYLAPRIGQTAADPAPKGSTSTYVAKIIYRPTAPVVQTNNISMDLQIVSEGSLPINYSRFEIRYWFHAGDLNGRTQQLNVDYAAVGASNVKGKFVPTNAGGQDNYLSITFDQGTGVLQPYTSSGQIIARIHKSDWTNYDQSSDYSFHVFTDFQDWDHIALYLDGKLVWGKEPH